MATPQYATMVVAAGSPAGPRKSYRMYCSDAAGAVTYSSGMSSEVLNGDSDVYVIDFFTPTALATMVSITAYVGGQPTGDVLACASNIATTIGRQFQQSPVLIKRGRSLTLVQA